MGDAVRSVLSKYATFSGRAGRPEFWWWVLALIIASIVAGLLDRGLGFDGGGPIGAVLTLATLLPSIAVAARRLHDTDRSAWWLLLALIPVAGGLVLLVFYCLSGRPGPNRFGPRPA